MAVRNVPEYGGYDYEFTEEVSEKFVCNICTKVLRDPHLTACCGQHFCQSCLKNWLKKRGKKSCPHCREDDFNHFLNKAQKREIGELKIHCTLCQEGCQWVGELDSLQTHLNSNRGCSYVKVSCTNECGEKMKKKDLQQHLMQECPLRNYKCEHCGHEDTYQAITGDAGREHPSLQRNHYVECPKIPLDCPNRCGARAILRKDMSDHRANCPLEPVECPFKEAGCTINLVRRDFDAHVATNQQQHTLMLMQAFKEMKTKLEAQERKTSELDTLMEVVATDVKILREDEQPQANIALESIQTQLELKTARLTEDGVPLTIRMPNFSQYKRSGKVWHSPPFYYDEGYKMCLVVYANGTGAGAGTHVSVSLLLLRGEFDDRLTWPMGGNGHEIDVQLLDQKQEEEEPSITISLCSACSPTTLLQRIPEGEHVRTVGSEEKFANHPTVQQYSLLHDSIVLRVSLEEDGHSVESEEESEVSLEEHGHNVESEEESEKSEVSLEEDGHNVESEEESEEEFD